jgi:3,2-trans-enoyl-CoA isomerase
MINTIGFRESEKALQLGKMYSPEEALAIGLVDEIVEPNNVFAKAEEEMQKWCKIPSNMIFYYKLILELIYINFILN